MELEWSAHFQPLLHAQDVRAENTLNAQDAVEEATFSVGGRKHV